MRLSLLSYQGILLTKDTALAIELLKAKAGETGWQVKLEGPAPGSEDGNPLSLVPAGREVHLRLSQGDSSPQASLNALWGCAVPLGFTPWCRYPIAGEPKANVLHFFGPWRPLYDRLMSEGRGHLAFPSVCCAAQCDVGMWKGEKVLELTLQAQLHRIGRNCGPLDGTIGPRTAQAIQSLSLGNLSLEQIVEQLCGMGAESPQKSTRQVGHIALPNRQLSVVSTGEIKVARTKQGAILTVDGPGRVVLDIGGAS